mmetsp:Transcript_18376/g.29004  ORF Transcript_18376/g.29004 Transcript_18376/m.29004 type:complete len:434 (+) Transcript_18376:102-1403(+)|eukprot:CAMPEP_0169107668 /NCGR_PEP_ID=MMETSP1015-20121227/25013_1 /TAXON_ID=342587 /ORGANISM="Karlodinium micrum, Strain CCMP2283" /LENGTH=433 /DNA_ID=CAMNT_0009169231 /DNA_START=55 /DNA_END=1356 /DNA_ORIENTATION=-
MRSDMQDTYKPVPLMEKSTQDQEMQRKQHLAYAKTTIGITMREGGTCKVEETVYGAAIVMPQMARTVGWDRTMTIMAVRAWFFLALNCMMQSYLLAMLSKEENVMDLFAGQMNLCDFGAFVDRCPGPGCKGPGGTDITASRMYNWDSFLNRNFVKDSFKALFPDRLEDIDRLVDPGEYGVESYWCRFMCCFVFMIPCMQELNIIIKMMELMYQIPSADEAWIEARDDLPVLGGIEEVRLKIAGMPMKWKVINLVFVIFPKVALWKLTCESGMTFLMETSGIQDIIVNSVALTFIVSLDQLIMSALMSEETRNIVANVEDYRLWDPTTSCVGDIALLSDDEILEKHEEAQALRSCGCKDFIDILPFKLFASLLLTLLFIAQYYIKYCKFDQENFRFVSKDVYLPKTTVMRWYQAFLPTFFPLEREDKPYWTMPG